MTSFPKKAPDIKENGRTRGSGGKTHPTLQKRTFPSDEKKKRGGK